MRVLPYRSGQGGIVGATLTFSDVTELFTTRRALDEDRERLELALRIGGVGVWQYDYEASRVELDEATRLMFALPRRDSYAFEEVVGRILNEDRQAVRDALAEAHREGKPYSAVYRIGTDEDTSRWLKAAGRFLMAPNGTTKMVGVVSDIDLERRVEQTRELMMSEMNHRVKNSFAVAAAVLRSSAREHESAKGLADDAGDRIEALARAHAATQPDRSGNARSLRELLDTILEAHTSNDAIVVGDGDLIIPSERITPLGLIIHEWMTNSMKYGSLSVENGKLNLSWSLNQQSNFPDEVSLSWIETLPQGLSVGNARPEKGFGSKLLNASVRQINGTLKTDFTPRGFEARLRFPV